MKIRLLVVLSVLSVIGFGNAFASDYPYPVTDRIEFAQLKEVKLDPKLNESGMKIGGGSVEINLTKDEVRLVVFRAPNCKPNMMCIKYMPAPLVFTLAIEDIRYDQTGVRIIDAKKDLRMVDGGLTTIRIKDFSERNKRVKYVRAQPDTTLVLKTKYEGRGGKVSTYSTFVAEELLELVDAQLE